jgi:hypothetical protein
MIKERYVLLRLYYLIILTKIVRFLLFNIGDIKEYGTILLVFLTNGNSNILLKIIYVF